MARPEMPFFVGTTRPSAVGWTRVLLTVVIGGVVIALMSQRPDLASPATITLVAVLFLGMTVWTFIHQWTRFVVDERGVTVSLGGFWPRQGWPLADFRTVQLRDLGDVAVSAAVGGLGWRSGRALTASAEQLRPVGSRKIHTLSEPRAPYRTLVTRTGMQVEIIGRGGVHYLLSPTDTEATAAAIDQAIRARR